MDQGGDTPRGPHFVYQGCRGTSCVAGGEVPTEGEGRLVGLGYLQSSSADVLPQL